MSRGFLLGGGVEMEEEKLRKEEKDTTVHVGEEGERERERLLGHMCGVSMCG